MQFDESFEICNFTESALADSLVEEAAKRYSCGESVQVLSPFNNATAYSVRSLNEKLQERLNPMTRGKPVTDNGLRDGDRVIIIKNDSGKNCSNGDVGILKIQKEVSGLTYTVCLPDGRQPRWSESEGTGNMQLAYALTVHRSQGSEYDTVLMPISNVFAGMLYRNLLYTAISRAKKKLILYGEATALDIGLGRSAKERRSMLTEKTYQRFLSFVA